MVQLGSYWTAFGKILYLSHVFRAFLFSYTYTKTNAPNRRPTKQEIWFKDTPEDGAKQAPKHVG
jgi:hypothetical protein